MSDEKQERRANVRINAALERFFYAVMSLGVTVVAGVQWHQYKDNADIKRLLVQHDIRIERNHELNLMLQSKIARIEGQMVGWDVIKRIELYMSSMSPGEADSALTKAIRAESEAREKSEAGR